MTNKQLYQGREQTLIKHLILRRYIQRFAFIIGSRWDSITYVDCFSGPWKSQSEKLSDTSFAIAIDELRKARDALQKNRGRHIQLRCFFLEKTKHAYAQLSEYVETIEDVEIEIKNAALEDSIEQIVRFVKQPQSQSFPFVFIDPKGWTGFALDIIQPLLMLDPGEVLINFMIEHIRRFIEAPDKKTQHSFQRLFGSQAFQLSLSGLSQRERDDAVVFEYMKNVKEAGKLRYASTAVVLHPETNRSHFNLIYLTRDLKGIEVFKDSERRTMQDMESVRAEAQQKRRKLKRGGQLELFSAKELHDTTYFVAMRNRYLALAKSEVLSECETQKRVPYEQVWTKALIFPLVWEADVKGWVSEWQSAGQLKIEGMKPRQRVPKLNAQNILVWEN